MPATRAKARNVQVGTGSVMDRWRAIFFANVLDNDLNKWKKIKYSLLPGVFEDMGWDGSNRGTPDDEWPGWNIVAEKAGIVDKIDSVFGHVNIDLGAVFNGAKLLEVDDDLVKSFAPATLRSQGDMQDEPPQKKKKKKKTKKKATIEPSPEPSMSLSLEPLGKEGDDEDLAGLTKALVALGDVPRFPRHDPPMEVVGKETRKKRGGKKQVVYRVHFIGQPDEEDSWFTPSRLRRDHKDGANQIEAFEKREDEGRAKSEQMRQKRQKRRGGLATALGMLSKHKLIGEDDGSDSDEGGSVESQPPEPKPKQGKSKKKGKAEGTSQGHRTFDETLQEKRRGAVLIEEEGKRNFFAIKNHAAKIMAARKAHKPLALPEFDYEPAKENVVPSGLQQEGEFLKPSKESQYRDWNISGLQVREDHILINFSNGKTMSSKQANRIPELGMKLAEKYTSSILHLWSVMKMMNAGG